MSSEQYSPDISAEYILNLARAEPGRVVNECRVLVPTPDGGVRSGTYRVVDTDTAPPLRHGEYPADDETAFVRPNFTDRQTLFTPISVDSPRNEAPEIAKDNQASAAVIALHGLRQAGRVSGVVLKSRHTRGLASVSACYLGSKELAEHVIGKDLLQHAAMHVIGWVL